MADKQKSDNTGMLDLIREGYLNPDVQKKGGIASLLNAVATYKENDFSFLEMVSLRVRKKRKEQGLNQQDLADMAGVGRRFVSELENGKETLEIGKVISVCDAVGIRLKVE